MSHYVSIPPWVPFLEALCRRWIKHFDGDTKAMGKGIILLPGRRAARSLAEAFGRVLDGQAALLPRIVAIGEVEGAELELLYPEDGSFWSMPRVMGTLERLSALSFLILRHDQKQPIFGTSLTLAQAWPLAQELAQLMDEAEREKVDLASALPKISQELSAEMSAHWQNILDFLEIITQSWPLYLEELGACNPVSGQLQILRRQMEIWQKSSQHEGAFPLWAVGFTHATASTRDLLKDVAHLPGGKIVFPALDMSLDEKSFFSLPDSHPQKGLADILHTLGVRREDVALWDAPSVDRQVQQQRWASLCAVMVPAADFRPWASHDPGQAFKNVSFFDAEEPQEQARGISMIIRQALEEEGQQIALVTPDRHLAELVRVSLRRWGISADDSAGTSLKETVGGILLRLIAVLMREDFTAASWLAVLKHPFVACGYTTKVCRALTRLVERKVLRGTSTGTGFKGIDKTFHHYLRVNQEASDEKKAQEQEDRRAVEAFMSHLDVCFAPLRQLEGATDVPSLLEALITVAENLTMTEEPARGSRLWRGEEGRTLSYCLAQLMQETRIIPPQKPDVIPRLLDSVFEQTQIPLSNFSQDRQLHPRVFIWGLLEARLQTIDVAILAGLNEGKWPAHSESGPWLNRVMRRSIGLPGADYSVGREAYGFCSLCARARQIVLSSARRIDEATAVPSRWRQRLDVYLRAQNYTLRQHPVADWLQALDQPVKVAPVSPPQPRPAVALRPHRLRVTEIETFVTNPYSIYAKHILGLEKLDPLQAEPGGREFGVIVHALMQWWFAQTLDAQGRPKGLDEERERTLKDEFVQQARYLLQRERLPSEIQRWWLSRLSAIGTWVVDVYSHQNEHTGDANVTIFSEKPGKLVWKEGDTSYCLTCRADYLSLDEYGGIFVEDYKSGQPPPSAQVLQGWSPQLVLESAMAQAGGFQGIDDVKDVLGWRYVQLSGGMPPGVSKDIVPGKENSSTPAEIGQSLLEALKAFWAGFDCEEQAYYAYPRPQCHVSNTDYEHLCRLEEWQFSTSHDEVSS